MTHDYGTTTLFAALDVLKGKVSRKVRRNPPAKSGAFLLSGIRQTKPFNSISIGTPIIEWGFLNAMPLFTVNITDLTEFDSPPREEWLERDAVPNYAKRLAKKCWQGDAGSPKSTDVHRNL